MVSAMTRGTGKTDERPWLGHDDVPQHGEAGRHAASGGIGEHGHVGQPLGPQALQSGRRLGHLHERQDALLHAGAAGGGDDDDGDVLGGGLLDGPGELFPHGRAHAPAQEREIERAEHGREAPDPGQPRHHRLAASRLFAGRAQPVPVALGVLEAQRVGRGQAAVVLLERPAVDEQRDALPRVDPEGVPALRAHAPRPLHLRPIHDLLARITLDPQPLRNDDLPALPLALLLAFTPEPRRHALLRCPRPRTVAGADPGTSCAANRLSAGARWGWACGDPYLLGVEGASRLSSWPADDGSRGVDSVVATGPPPPSPRSASLSDAMKSPTSDTSDGEPARSSMSRTIADPTITPSAKRPTAAA